MEIKISQSGNPVLFHNGIYGTKGISSEISEDEKLKELAIKLISENYSSPYKDSAIEDIINSNSECNKRFFIRLKEGNDIISESFTSHKSATWHLFNDKNENGELKYCTEYGPFCYVWEEPDTMECPYCGEQEYFSPDGDNCSSCGKWVEL